MSTKYRVSAVTADCNWKLLQQKQPELKRKKKKLTEHERVKESSDDIWFDDVDEVLIETSKPSTSKKQTGLVKETSYNGITKILAMDCEMVGVGHQGEDSIVARVSIVNQFGHCVYDKFVKPTEPVVNYRTEISGVRPADLYYGTDFKVVQQEVSDMLKNKILVGHALRYDLKVLFLSHPKKDIRDTSKYFPFRRVTNGKTPSLKALSKTLLGVEVQKGEHNSIQDAQAAMRLYTMHKKQWEKSIKEKRSVKNSKVKVKSSS